MDLLLLVTLGASIWKAYDSPKSVLAGVCLVDLWGWIPQKQVEVQLHVRHCCFLFFCKVQGLSLLLERIFLAVPKSLSSVYPFNLLLRFSKPFWHVISGSLAAQPTAA